MCGKVVPFTAMAINDLFQLSDYAEDGYSSLLSKATEATFAQVLRIVAVEGIDCIRSGR